MTAEKSISFDQPLAPPQLRLVPDEHPEAVTPFSHEVNTACHKSIASLKMSVADTHAKITTELEAIASLTKGLCDFNEMIDDGIRIKGVAAKRAQAEVMIHERYQAIAVYESDIARVLSQIAELEAMRENLE